MAHRRAVRARATPRSRTCERVRSDAVANVGAATGPTGARAVPSSPFPRSATSSISHRVMCSTSGWRTASRSTPPSPPPTTSTWMCAATCAQRRARVLPGALSGARRVPLPLPAAQVLRLPVGAPDARTAAAARSSPGTQTRRAQSPVRWRACAPRGVTLRVRRRRVGRTRARPCGAWCVRALRART